MDVLFQDFQVAAKELLLELHRNNSDDEEVLKDIAYLQELLGFHLLHFPRQIHLAVQMFPLFLQPYLFSVHWPLHVHFWDLLFLFLRSTTGLS